MDLKGLGVNKLYTVSLTFRFMPESFRWLVSHRRFDSARQVIEKMARINGKPVPDLSHVEEVAMNDETTNRHTYSLLDLFRTNYIRKHTLLMSVIW